MSGSGGNGTNELLVDKLGFNLSKINFVPKSQVGQFNVLPPCLFSKVASHLWLEAALLQMLEECLPPP